VNLPATGHGSSPPREYATRQMVMALNRLVSSDLPTRITPELKEMLRSLARFETFPNSLVMRLSNWPVFRALVSRGLRENNFMAAMTHDTATLTGVVSDTLATNAIPARVEASLDCRLLPGTTEQGFIEQLKKILADPRVEIQVMNHSPMALSTPPDAVFTALCDTFSANDPKAIPTRFLFPASSDGNAFRGQGHAVFGIIPAKFEQSEIDGVHAKNEAIREVSLEQGVRQTLETCLRLRGWAGPK
jgi:carboxypeptidase PM20D1